VSELRRDPITDRWVIYATEFRQAPPTALDKGAPRALALCPFCPGNENLTPHEITASRPVVPGAPEGQWQLRVIPNQFPVLRVEGALDPHAEGLYDVMQGIGANEVLIESPDHTRDLDSLPLDQVELVLWTVRERFLDLRKDPRIQYVQAFKNYGDLAGSALAHPHLQLVGLPWVPKALREELAGAQRHQALRGRCVFCDILRQETRQPERLVAENDFFLVFEPYASRFPFETWILPKRHAADYAAAERTEVRALAKVLQEHLIRQRNVLRDPAYHLIWHTAPCPSAGAGLDFHWHLEIVPRIARPSGFELATDCYLNPTLPEHAAAFLREASI
jgi:UDPglucose--hexose-1-phosphate uridylyltransferase